MDGLDMHACLHRLPQKMRFTSSAASTYGSGDVPDNARNLYDSLSTCSRNTWVNVRSTGSSHSATVPMCRHSAFGGKKFDERLQGLGAQRIGEVSHAMTPSSAARMPEELKAQPGAANGLRRRCNAPNQPDLQVKSGFCPIDTVASSYNNNSNHFRSQTC